MYRPNTTSASVSKLCSRDDSPVEECPPYTFTNKIRAATAAAIIFTVRFLIIKRRQHTIMNTTIPVVRCPIRASFIDAIIIDTIEQKRKKLFICTHF